MHHNNQWCPKAKAVAKAKELEETHTDLLAKLSKVPVDALLYIAITRATWGIIVVEPDARRFVQHYVVGKEGRARSRLSPPLAGRLSTIRRSCSSE